LASGRLPARGGAAENGPIFIGKIWENYGTIMKMMINPINLKILKGSLNFQIYP
jgi:hypothetical protein